MHWTKVRRKNNNYKTTVVKTKAYAAKVYIKMPHSFRTLKCPTHMLKLFVLPEHT